jgi:hypothetical protein
VGELGWISVVVPSESESESESPGCLEGQSGEVSVFSRAKGSSSSGGKSGS